MTYDFEIDPGINTAYVTTDDNRFSIAIERTAEGLEVRVYPITQGDIWDCPYTCFFVDEGEIIELERQMEIDA